MKVITGTAKGKKLTAPAGVETRPTAQMVKEAAFSAIQFEIEGANVLDLFAGSGQMGVEALSRGARTCVFVDNARAAQGAVRDNLEKTGLSGRARVVASDAFSYLRTASGPFDIVFLDPPYGQGMAAKALGLVAEKMRQGGVILCETGSKEELPEVAGDFTRFREHRFGARKVTQYRQAAAE